MNDVEQVFGWLPVKEQQKKLITLESQIMLDWWEFCLGFVIKIAGCIVGYCERAQNFEISSMLRF